jgi:chromate transporter
MLVSRASRLPQFSRLLKAMQRGLGPVALGLMAATSFLLVRAAPGVWKGAAITAVTVGLLALTRLPPLSLIVAAGITGALVPW